MNYLPTLGEDFSSMAGVIVPIVAITFGCTVGIVAVIVKGVRGTRERRHREESRREIAAYVAEGSLNIDQAERLIAAGERPEDRND